jgi:hypothetical protein
MNIQNYNKKILGNIQMYGQIEVFINRQKNKYTSLSGITY